MLSSGEPMTVAAHLVVKARVDHYEIVVLNDRGRHGK